MIVVNSQVGCFDIYCGIKSFNLDLKRLKNLKLKGRVGLTICANLKIKRINKKFRGKDKPTDVLSFPFSSEKIPGPFILGDIVISVEYLKRNTDNWKIFFWRALVHGLAHLEGHKHQNSKQHTLMNKREKILLKRLGICSI